MKGKKAALLLAVTVFFVGIPFLAKASEETGSSIKSSGNIIYKSGAGSVELYAEDIALLQERLASIPEGIFDPVVYSHAHEWVYTNIGKSTHTKHCDGCGPSYDVVNQHEAVTTMCKITRSGVEYLGYTKKCPCGYTWIEEAYHNLIHIPKDTMLHTLTCALEGTSYCSGFGVIDEEHMNTLHPDDDTHHHSVCTYCDFAGEIKECVFMDEVNDDGEVTGRKYCECGNIMTVTEDPIPGQPDPPDPEDGGEGSQPEEAGDSNHEAPANDIEEIAEGGKEL